MEPGHHLTEQDLRSGDVERRFALAWIRFRLDAFAHPQKDRLDHAIQ
jgi:hypothetical protein